MPDASLLILSLFFFSGMSWSKLCCGPLDPSLKFRALPSESATSSSKFVVPKLAPLASEAVEDAETDTVGSKECADQSSRAPSAPDANLGSKSVAPNSEKIPVTGKKRSLPSKPTSAQPKAKKITRARKKIPDEDGSSDSSESSVPSDSSEEIQDERLPMPQGPVPVQVDPPKDKEPIPLSSEFVSSEKNKDKEPTAPSLSTISEKFKLLRLYESERSLRRVEDPSAPYAPDWSISRGSTMKTMHERAEFLFSALPPGARNMFAQTPNITLLENYARFTVGSFAAGQELMGRFSRYEAEVKRCSDILDAVESSSKSQGGSSESLVKEVEKLRKDVLDLEKLKKDVSDLRSTVRSQGVTIKSLNSQLEVSRRVETETKGDVETLSKVLKNEKERYKKLEFEKITFQKELQEAKGTLALKEAESEGEKKKVTDLEKECSGLKEQMEVLKAEVERERSIKRRCFTEVIPHVVKEVRGCTSFVEPFRKVIEVCMDKGFQGALEKFHEDGLLGDVPLGSVPYFDSSVSDKYDKAVADLDNIELPYLDKIIASSEMDVEDVLKMVASEVDVKDAIKP